MSTPPLTEQEELYRKARKRVENLKDFYIHLAVYVVVNIFLIVTNLMQSPQHIWFYWPLLGWGIGVLFHAISVFGFFGMFNSDWEERKVQEFMERERQKKIPNKAD